MNRFKLQLLSLTVIALSTLNILFSLSFSPSKSATSLPMAEKTTSVLGRSVENFPQIYIDSSHGGYSVGGVMSQTSLSEPVILLESNDSGQVTLDIYQSKIEEVLNFLTYDRDKTDPKSIDYSSLTKVNSLTTAIIKQTSNRILLPIEGEGIWLVRIQFGNQENFAYLIRTSITAVAKEGNKEILVWAEDVISKKTLPTASLEVFSLDKEVKSIAKSKTDTRGLMKIRLDAKIFDVAVITFENHIALLPLNLSHLNYSYSKFKAKTDYSRYFVFTDRPLYQPGDTVYYKAVIRDDNDSVFELPSGLAQVKAYKNWDEKNTFYEQSLTISANGTVTGQFVLPPTQGTGNFQLSVAIPDTTVARTGYDDWSQNVIGFQVEFFRKPDYFLDLTSPNQVYIAGNPIEATVVGAFFSGQPVSDRLVDYTVYSHDYYEYEFLYDNAQFFDAADFNYGYWQGQKISEGNVTLDNTGTAKIVLPTGDAAYRKSKSQVVTLEAQFKDESGNPVVSRKNFLIYPGEFSIFRHSSFYNGQVNRTYNLPILLKSHTSASIKDIRLTAKVTRESWIAQPLAPGEKYPNYIKETQELPPLSAITDQLGKAQFSFTPQQTGSYRFVIEGVDRKGNTVSKDMYTWISDIDRPTPRGEYYQQLKIDADKLQYEPTDKLNLRIWSDIPDSDFWLTFERERVRRSQIVHVSGQTASVSLDLEEADVPNVYVTVSGFSDNSFISDTQNIPVSPDSKHLKVIVAPEAARYGPGQTAVVNLETRDAKGKPVQADIAFWAVDKAIFELSDSNLGDIFDRFWSERYNNTNTSISLQSLTTQTAEMGGCFLADTQILMSDGSTKSIEQVKMGDRILTKSSPDMTGLAAAKVTGTHSTTEDGYIIINAELRLTPSHILFVNDTWKTAAEVTFGDLLSDQFGNSVPVESIEWQAGQTSVYNLEVEKYHTFIADGYYVHNQKGGSARSVFKDTAYWNPTIKTGADGKARIAFKLPDNLTTWTLAAVASTVDTKVGQATSELKISKEVFIRPVLPNFIRTGDSGKLSALIYNYTDVPQDFEANLEFKSAKITSPVTQSSLLVNPNNFRQVFWNFSTAKDDPAAKIEMSIKSKLGKSDSVVTSLPILPFGFEDLDVRTATGNQTFSLDIPSDTNLEKSSLTISLASNLLGNMPIAMKYLLGYPYGCVEQTTSRLVPALIAKNNLDIYYDAVELKDLEKIISQSLERLITLQNLDGGWGWWSEGTSQPYITAYVLENLLIAQKSGFDVPASLTESATNYFVKLQPSDPIQTVYKIYGLSLVNSPNLPVITNFENLSPVPLALAVLANSRVDKNPTTNGLSKLISLGIPSGDAIYWPYDTNSPYPSIESSTALAMRAILEGGGDRALAAKSTRYLLTSQKEDYWANTHATAQLVNAVTMFYKTGAESNPGLTYSVDVNNKTVSTGKITSSTQLVKPIVIPSSVLTAGKNQIVITKAGSGELYSTLSAKYWRTDAAAAAASNTISLTKKIVNAKNRDYSIGVGDTVTVELSLTGLPPNSRYLVIEDQLPAGLIPINTNLNNNSTDNQSQQGDLIREFTSTGVVLSSFHSSSTTYTYQARAVTEGTFQTPPATAQLMYQPEISARTTTETLTIGSVSKPSLSAQVQSTVSNSKQILAKYGLLIAKIIAGLIIFVTAIFVVTKIIKHRRPPTEPPPPIQPPPTVIT